MMIIKKLLSEFEWRDIMHSWHKEKVCGGSADITPSYAIAQSKERFTIDFVVGQEGMCLRGGLTIYIPIFFGGVTQKKGFRGFYSCKEKPGSGYLVTAKVYKPNVEIIIDVSTWRAPSALIRLTITKGNLTEGDKISVIIGDPIDLPINVQEIAQEVKFPIGVDFDATGKYRRIEEFPSLQVRGGAPDKLQITAQAIQKVGVPFEVVIAAVDKCNCNPSWQYDGKVEFFSTDSKASLPASYQFDDKDKGVYRFTNIVFNTPGTHTITALDMGNGIIGKSHPISTDFMADDNKVYFGELHAHTSLSDGTGTTDECYGLARGADNFDFAAIGDHTEDSLSNISRDAKLKLIQDACRRYYEPNKFVTFLGFEWTFNHGNKNVYYRDDTGDFLASDSPASDTPDKLFSILKDKDVIIIPHHSKYIWLTDWSFHSKLQRLVEIYSIAGCSETGGEHSVQYALAQGHRLGFIAGSDNHSGQLGHNESPYKKAGIAVVIARELTRDAIFDAFKSRHCYATTGKRILLDFRLNGHMMGKEIILNAFEKRVIKVKVAGTAKIKKIDVVRNNVDIYTYYGKCENEEFEYCDSTNISELLLSSSPPALPYIFYYIRVTQIDGEMAWASPIWISTSKD